MPEISAQIIRMKMDSHVWQYVFVCVCVNRSMGLWVGLRWFGRSLSGCQVAAVVACCQRQFVSFDMHKRFMS